MKSTTKRLTTFRSIITGSPLRRPYLLQKQSGCERRSAAEGSCNPVCSSAGPAIKARSKSRQNALDKYLKKENAVCGSSSQSDRDEPSASAACSRPRRKQSLTHGRTRKS